MREAVELVNLLENIALDVGNQYEMLTGVTTEDLGNLLHAIEDCRNQLAQTYIRAFNDYRARTHLPLITEYDPAGMSDAHMSLRPEDG